MNSPIARDSDSQVGADTSSNPRLESVLSSLWKNWAFRLSLSSNELFHSNTLQYLAEILSPQDALLPPPAIDLEEALEETAEGTKPANPSPSDELPQIVSRNAVERLLSVLSGWDTNGPQLAALQQRLNQCTEFWVRREWKQMDLVVSGTRQDGMRGSSAWDRPLFALEVKVKAYPTVDQIAGYKEKLKSAWIEKKSSRIADYDPPLFLRTGMGGRGVDQEFPPGVHILGFLDLSSRLSEQLGAVQADNPVAKEYIALCKGMNELFDCLGAELRPELKIEETEKISSRLLPYRLHSLWWKLWAAYVKQQVDIAIKKAAHYPETSDYLKLEHGFTHVGSVNAYWHWNNGGKDQHFESIGVGVQIEGRTMRLFLNVAHPEITPNAKDISARRGAERVLLALARTGLFMHNPAIAQYKKYWAAKQNRNVAWFTNREALELFGATVGDQAPHDGDYFDLNKSARRGMRIAKGFCLHGYENGSTFGHADFRLWLKHDVSIADIANLVRDILLDGKYSGPPALDQASGKGKTTAESSCRLWKDGGEPAAANGSKPLAAVRAFEQACLRKEGGAWIADPGI